jgi:hypothetical protein
MRSIQATHNLLAVSALLKEAALNTEATLDTGMLCDLAAMFAYEPRRESNADEAIGKEEPDALYNLGALASMELAFSKAQAQHAGFIMAYALGARSVTAAGTGGYRHTITPIAGDLDGTRSNPSFTAAMRYGKHLLKRRFGGCVIDSFTLSLKKDSWMNIKASVKSTGKILTTFFRDAIAGFCDDETVTLTDAVAGSTAQERMDNVHLIQYQKPTTLEWIDVAFSVVSAADGAAITITAPGGGHVATTYRVWYNRKEENDYAWALTFPSRVSEPPLRVSDFIVNIGGKWSGGAILGGHQLSGDINSFEWTFNNDLKPEFTPGAGSGVYANRALRGGRTQKISLDREFRDYLLGQRLDDNETMVIYAIAEGAEYDTVNHHHYTVELVFPKVAVLNTPYSLDGKRLAEKGDLLVMEDDTDGSVIAYVKNMVATYAA